MAFPDIAHHSFGLFARHQGKSQFVGSSFFFLHGGQVLAATADHCIRPETNLYTMVSTAGPFDVEVALRDQAHDLCILLPKAHPADVSMTLVEAKGTPGNIVLYLHEYSTTEIENGSWHTNPATRVGNCVRNLPTYGVFGPAGEDMLELSFPALRGASGAPVLEIRGHEFRAHGIVVANSERHLLPAHIETVLDAENQLLEERKYFLPQAVAVNAKHLAILANTWLSSAGGSINETAT
jgi:hypothetical protein